MVAGMEEIKKVAGADGESKESECSHYVDLGRHWSSRMLRVLLEISLLEKETGTGGREVT
jgi:hypothetical protein